MGRIFSNRLQEVKAQTPNKGLARPVPIYREVAVQGSADTPDSYQDAVNQTFVLYINTESFRDGKNRHLSQAQKRLTGAMQSIGNTGNCQQ